MKKVLSIILSIFMVFTLLACNKKKLQIKNIDITNEEEFGGIYIKKTIEEFNELGFTFGDSVDITFTNGYKLKDIPYYNGYYVDAGSTLLVGYPGYDYIKAAINYGDDLFVVANLSLEDKATITLNKTGKYLDIQKSCDITYYDDKSLFESDEIFANFRAMNVGNLKENILYRSASPCDNKRKRASTTDSLMEREEIKFIINLADTPEKIESYIEKEDFNSPYFLSLYQSEKFFLTYTNDDKDSVIPLAMNMNYTSEEFAEKVALGFKSMLNSDGAILIHCQEGKDRTGFVCIVIEALMSATYKEIVDDYMLTYNNYYGIDINDDRYEIIKKRNVDAMLKFICKDADYTKGDLSSYARNYLKYGGMTDTEITQLINKLKK